MKQKKLKYSRIFLRDSFYYSKYSTLWKKRKLFLKDNYKVFQADKRNKDIKIQPRRERSQASNLTIDHASKFIYPHKASFSLISSLF